MDVEKLVPLKAVKDTNIYMRITKRQKAGTMTTYVVKGKKYYDPDEFEEYIQTGARLKCLPKISEKIIFINKKGEKL